ncbi:MULTISPECIES: YggT family protein [unclassified Fusobacterium]|nr:MULTISPECIES: YggT family protein [unclassified Fusobacterium]
MITLLNLVNTIISIINTLILIRVIVSWLAPNSHNGFTDMLYSVTEPILRPFRVLIPMRNMRIDISPIIAYVFLNILRRLIFILIFR